MCTEDKEGKEENTLQDKIKILLETVGYDKDRVYKELFDNTGTAVAVVNDDGIILEVNKEYEKLTGYRKNEIEGCHYRKVVDPEDLNKVLANHEKRRSSGEDIPTQYEWRLVSKYGDIRNVAVTVGMIPDSSLRIVSLLDITDMKKRDLLIKEYYGKLEDILSSTVHTLASMIDMRDPYTAGHQERAAKLCMAIGERMKLPEDRLHALRIAALLHDIGKIQIPIEILTKPGKITFKEFELIKDHSNIGYNILKNIPFNQPIAEIINQHHEKLDGSGYPLGLKGEDILLEARILSVADVVEAMSSHRPYRPALGIEAALEEISENKGKKYDTKVVEVCIELFKEGAFSF